MDQLENLPVVNVGDVLLLQVDKSGSIRAQVIKVRRSKKKNCGWKYYLKVLDESNEQVIKSTLIGVEWSLLKRRFNPPTHEESSPVPIPIAKKSKGSINFPAAYLHYVVAPMVGASELPFRLLCRKYGATLAYTPMINADKFAVDVEYRREEFQTTAADRPLVAHFAANNPGTFLAAARHVESYCDAIDLNLGCPQRVAYVGHYGSFLLDDADRPLILDLVRTIAENCSIPIFVKIRLLDKLEDTIILCRQLVQAGASLIAIHGRYRVNLVNRTGPGARDGPAHLDQIKAVRDAISEVPIICNGNVRSWSDVVENKNFTGASGIMSAEGLLDNPALFNGGVGIDPLTLALEYLILLESYPTKLKTVIFHIRRMCKDYLVRYQLMDECLNADSIDKVRQIIDNMIHFKKTGQFIEDPVKVKLEKEALERRKREEGKRKEFEARMVRKAKREGKPLDFYLQQGSSIPTLEELNEFKSMTKEKAFEIWRSSHGQHCWAFHFEGGCPRDRKCSFLHTDVRMMTETEIFG